MTHDELCGAKHETGAVCVRPKGHDQYHADTPHDLYADAGGLYWKDRLVRLSTITEALTGPSASRLYEEGFYPRPVAFKPDAVSSFVDVYIAGDCHWRFEHMEAQIRAANERVARAEKELDTALHTSANALKERNRLRDELSIAKAAHKQQ